MSILIPGMKMPTGRPIRIEITADGAVREIIDPFLVIPSGTAIELPPHGRLIDADAFLARNAYFADREFVNPMYDDTLKDLIDRADTILPADGGADNDG